MIRQLTTLTLVATLSMLGMPLPATAGVVGIHAMIG